MQLDKPDDESFQRLSLLLTLYIVVVDFFGGRSITNNYQRDSICSFCQLRAIELTTLAIKHLLLSKK